MGCVILCHVCFCCLAIRYNRGLVEKLKVWCCQLWLGVTFICKHTTSSRTQTYILPLNSCGLKNNRPMLYIQHWWSLPIFIKKYIFQRHTVFYFPFNSLCFSLIWFANLWFANNETCTSPWLVLPLHSTQTAHIFTHTAHTQHAQIWGEGDGQCLQEATTWASSTWTRAWWATDTHPGLQGPTLTSHQ